MNRIVINSSFEWIKWSVLQNKSLLHKNVNGWECLNRHWQTIHLCRFSSMTIASAYKVKSDMKGSRVHYPFYISYLYAGFVKRTVYSLLYKFIRQTLFYKVISDFTTCISGAIYTYKWLPNLYCVGKQSIFSDVLWDCNKFQSSGKICLFPVNNL